MSRDTPIESSLQSFEETANKKLHTAYPGSIISFDPETKLCSVQVHYSDFYASEGPEPIREDWTPLDDIPVAFPRGGGFCLTWPLRKGDPVLVIFCERSIDEWYASDGKSDISPLLPVTHDESDAIVIPGLFPSKNAEGEADDENVILTTPAELQIIADGAIRLGTTDAAKALALAEKTDARINSLQAKVDALAAGTATAAAASGLWFTIIAPIGPLATTASERMFTDK